MRRAQTTVPLPAAQQGARGPQQGAWGEVPGWRDAWPTPAQRELLRATLLPDERALAAWQRVRPLITVESLDGPTQALLPHLRATLVSHDVRDELLELFKGVHRYCWARNQTLLAQMIPVVRGLEETGTSTLLLKGAAFLADRRLEAGMRPMNDIDVLVPEDRRGEAIATLLRAGLRPVGEVPTWYVADYAPCFVPSHGFRDEQDRQLDLHWNVLHASRQPHADDDFWEAAVPVELLGTRTRTLCPADELLLVILHGLRWNATPTYRWALDATLLVRGTLGEIDYDRLIGQARVRRVTVGLWAGLLYLRQTLAAPVPDEALRALAKARALSLERMEFRAQMMQPSARSPLQWEVLYHQRDLRRNLALGRRPSLATHVRRARRRGGSGNWHGLARGRLAPPVGVGVPFAEVAAAFGNGTRATSTQPLDFGEPLELGKDGHGNGRVAYGMWCPEDEGCWIAGRETKLVLPLRQPVRSSLLLELAVEGFVTKARASQHLQVLVGGRSLGWLQIDERRRRREESFVLPRALLAGCESLEIVLRAPDAVSPARLGLHEDDRALGVFVRRVTLREPCVCRPGDSLALGTDSQDHNMLAGGWGLAEPSGRWTYGARAGLLLALADVHGHVQLEFDATPLLGSVCPTLGVHVSARGQTTSVTCDEAWSGPLVVPVRLPAHLDEDPVELPVVLRIDDPRSPAQLGMSADTRPLGLFVCSVSVAEAA